MGLLSAQVVSYSSHLVCELWHKDAVKGKDDFLGSVEVNNTALAPHH
jgi:hypothetical protein